MIKRGIAVLALCLLAGTALGNEQTDKEVQYLLEFVANSGCTFVRNGSDHDPADAADHLRLKYSRGSKYVNSADQFIHNTYLILNVSCLSPRKLCRFFGFFKCANYLHRFFGCDDAWNLVVGDAFQEIVEFFF